MKLNEFKDNLKQEITTLNENVACFTGHRSQKLPWRFDESDVRCLAMKELAKLEIENAILNEGITHFISGMALGFDMIAAELVLELKKLYPNIILECAIPCKGQESKWPILQQKRYHDILKQADKIRCIYSHYEDGCMQERNKYMINNLSLVIALYNGMPGGTQQTLNYAKEKGLKVKIINF